MRIAFLTSTPLAIRQGSGTFVGIATLQAALERLGVTVDVIAPQFSMPVLTARRLIFNEQLLRRDWRAYDVIAGFDMDGYRIAGRTGTFHVAAPKGVIADEMRFERGITRALMRIQAACEQIHVRRANRVIATSRYSAETIRRLYGLSEMPAVVPELIDLASWREYFAKVEPRPKQRFTLLSVCRFYPRKRLGDLIEAAFLLRESIPELEVRIVGGGPQEHAWREQARKLGLQRTVTWLKDIDAVSLAREYVSADLFCLPSAQEGFGIVFLEAMAAGLPVVAARAGAAPELVPTECLAECGNPRSLAEVILRFYQRPEERARWRVEGLRRVAEFDAPLVAQKFLEALRP